MRLEKTEGAVTYRFNFGSLSHLGALKSTHTWALPITSPRELVWSKRLASVFLKTSPVDSKVQTGMGSTGQAWWV